jgi:hypothetical protein
MLRLASERHFFGTRALIAETEIADALKGRESTRPFFVPSHLLFKRFWKFLTDAAKPIPHDPQLLEDIRKDRAAQKEKLQTEGQTVIGGAASKDTSIRKRSNAELLQMVRSRYEETCRRFIARSEEGAMLLRRMGTPRAVRRLRATRVFHEAGLLFVVHRARSGKRIAGSDIYDLWHLVFGSYADIFVTGDEKLRELALGIQEPRSRCLRPDEFLQEAKELAERSR